MSAAPLMRACKCLWWRCQCRVQEVIEAASKFPGRKCEEIRVGSRWLDGCNCRNLSIWLDLRGSKGLFPTECKLEQFVLNCIPRTYWRQVAAGFGPMMLDPKLADGYWKRLAGLDAAAVQMPVCWLSLLRDRWCELSDINRFPLLRRWWLSPLVLRLYGPILCI